MAVSYLAVRGVGVIAFLIDTRRYDESYSSLSLFLPLLEERVRLLDLLFGAISSKNVLAVDNLRRPVEDARGRLCGRPRGGVVLALRASSLCR